MAKELSKKEIEELRRLINFLEKDINNIDFNNLIKSETSARTLLESLRKEADSFVSDIGKASEGFRNIVNDIKKTNTSALDVAKSFDKLSSIAEQIKFHQSGINTLSVKEIEGLKTKAQIENERLKASESGLLRRKLELGSELDVLNLKKSTSKLTDEEQRERRKLNKEYEKTKSALDSIKSVIKDNNDLYNGLVVTLDKASNKLEEQEKLSKNLLGLGGLATEGVAKALGKIGLGGLSKQLGVDEAKDKMKALADQIIADKEKEASLVQSINQLTDESNKLSTQLVTKEKELLDIKEKITLIDALTQQREELKFEKELLDSKKQSIGLTQEERKERTKLNKEIKNIEVSLKGLGSIESAKEVEAILEKQVESTKERKEEIKNILELEKEELKTISKSNKEMEGMGGKISILKAGFASMGGSLAKNLNDPLVRASLVAGAIVSIVKGAINILKDADKGTGELAKSFGLSYQGALGVRKELTDIAFYSGDAAVTTKSLQESMVAIGQSLGSNAKLNKEDLVTFTQLRERAGYTNEELVSMQKLTLATGGNLKENTKEFLGTVKALGAQNKLVLNEKQLLKEVSNVSNAIKLSLGGTVKNLAEAVVKTKQFGIDLNQADKIAGGLLDFEKSINAELEAELLTGKDLNLDKARLLALNGDIAGASAEILKQVGGTAEFTKMNRIQQEAMANAVGLTREELANSLVEREALAKMSGIEGKTAKERYENLVKQVGEEKARQILGNESLANQLKSQSIQEKFNQSMEKLKDIMVKLMEGPFYGFLESLSKAADFVDKIIGKFGQLGQGLKNLLGENLAGALGTAASLATIGALMIVMGKSLARGTRFSPLWVRMDGGMGGGMGPDLDMDGGGGGPGKPGKPGGFGRLKQAFKGGGTKGLLKASGRMLKSGAPKLLKGAAGGVGSLLGGLALDYAASSQFEKEARLKQEAEQATTEQEKKKKLEEAEKAKNVGKGLDVGSAALTGASFGGMIGSIIPGVGTAIGAGVGGILGAGYGLLSNFGSSDKTKEPGMTPENMDTESMEDFIWRPGQRPVKFRKDDVVLGGTSIDNNLKPKNTLRQVTVAERLAFEESTKKDSNKKSSALAGAGLGALIGTAIMPGLGTIVGAGIGSIVGIGYGLVDESSKLTKTQQENINKNVEVTTEFSKLNKVQQEVITKNTGSINKNINEKTNVTEAITKSIGSTIRDTTDFSRLNRIQQESLIKSIGPKEPSFARLRTSFIQNENSEISSPISDKVDVNVNDKLEKAIARLEASFINAINNLNNRPIEVRTIAQIDGEKAGSTLSRYATTNGTVANQFSYKTQ